MIRVCFDVEPDSNAGRILGAIRTLSPEVDCSALVAAEFERLCSDAMTDSALMKGMGSEARDVDADADEVLRAFAISKKTAAAIARFSEITELTPDQIGEQFLSIVATVVEDGAGSIAHHSLEYWTYDDPKERKRVEARLARMEADELAVEAGI